MATTLHAADTTLPDIGSSAGTIASPEQQRQYGFYVLHELRNQNVVVDDALLSDYINSLGYKLVSYSPRPDQPFTFFIVRDPEINAFALPGGFVAVFSALITMTTSENELAAVLAHEISHVTQNHMVRAIEAEDKATPLMLLAMLGVMIAASHEGQSPYAPGGSTDNVGGAIASVVGLAQQMQINFSRQDEAEADRVGIQTLARADFDPDAMAGVFERMQHELRPGFDENDVPALLMDHPVTLERISEAKARAEVLKKEINPTVSVGDLAEAGKSPSQAAVPDKPADAPTGSATARNAPISSTLLLSTLNPSANTKFAALDQPAESRVRQHLRSEAYYEFMRERARVLAAGQPSQLIAYYTQNLHDNSEFDTPANRYGHALALIRAGRAKEAVEEMRKLAAAQPENLVLQLGLGQAELLSGARDAALKRFAELETRFSDNRPLALAYAEALTRGDDRDSAKRAQEILRPQLAKDDEDPDLQTAFARACELAGDPIRAGEAHAAAAFLNGRAEDALNQLKQLAKRSDLDYYQRTRIDARITEMTPIVLELRRRHIKPEEQGKFSMNDSDCGTGVCIGLSSARNNSPLQ